MPINGHSRSLKVIRFCVDRRGIYDFLLVLNRNLTFFQPFLRYQSDALESAQKRAMRIIYFDDNSGDYKIRIIIAGIDTPKDRREVLTDRLFKRHVLPSSSFLHYILPDRRDIDTVNSFRHSQPFRKLRTLTTRFRNCFIPHCLNTYTDRRMNIMTTTRDSF